MFIPTDHPYRRLNPLTGEWVRLSAHQTDLAWQDPLETAHRGATFPGNDAQSNCRVVQLSPKHNKPLPQLALPDIERLIETWCAEADELGTAFRWVEVLATRGGATGSPIPQAHGQIWASNFLPELPAREDALQRDYFAKHRRPMLIDVAVHESAAAERVVIESAHWLAIVPYWAARPFETLLLPKFCAVRLEDLDADKRADLAVVLKRLATRYDNLFQTSFPYRMSWHGAPYDTHESTHWELHAHFYPSYPESACARECMAALQMLVKLHRALTPEQAAAWLRKQSDIYYLDSQSSAP